MIKNLGLRMSLRTAILFYVLVPMTAASVFIGLWGVHAFERQVEKRLQNDLELVAHAIKLPLSHAIQRDREGSIAQALESAFAVDQVYGAYVYDSGGEELASTGRGEPDSDRAEMSEIADDGSEHGEFGEVDGQDVYSYFVPLEDSGGRITGLLHLTRRDSDFQDQIRSIRYKAAGIFLAAFLCLSGLVFYGHHRALGKHLNRLSGAMNKIADGNRQHRYSMGGPREIAALGHHFNQMMDNINRAETEIRQRRQEQKDLEQRLQRAEKLAAIGQLAAGVAHELGTPLSVIGGKAQRALRDGRLSEATARQLEDIRFELRRMEQIIRQLQDFSRKNEIRPKRVQASQLAGSARSALDHETRRMQTRILLSGGHDVQLEADPIQMEQVLNNLIRNGIQAAGKNGTVRVSWNADPDAGTVVFNVEDDGPGISEEMKSKLFEPFFTTKPVGSGTGLGLAVVHGIVEAHNGHIETADSELGGLCFSLHLPLAVENTISDKTTDHGKRDPSG